MNIKERTKENRGFSAIQPPNFHFGRFNFFDKGTISTCYVNHRPNPSLAASAAATASYFLGDLFIISVHGAGLSRLVSFQLLDRNSLFIFQPYARVTEMFAVVAKSSSGFRRVYCRKGF